MKNEELKTRREFFKKAAQTALPILGAIVLASNPVIAKAAEGNDVAGCQYCYNTCDSGCKGGCRTTCRAKCADSCDNTCRGYCIDTCRGGCYGSCTGSSR